MVGESAPETIGRYALFDEIAAGGMATVHLGRLVGAAGFSRVVAIKRLHRQFVRDPEFVSMLIDEARLAARIRHPNVVPTLDVVNTDDELFVVMEYVQGESLMRLFKASRKLRQPIEPAIAVAIIAGALHGLHAAHTARGEQGEELQIVHRDVSPQNVMVGIDGVPRVLDFGIAKATGRVQTTKEGQIKGKLAYMAPEQLAGEEVGPTTDVYAASLVLWEALTGRRAFQGDQEAELFGQVLLGEVEPPSQINAAVPTELDGVVMQGLARSGAERHASARAMALALEETGIITSTTKVGDWVEGLAPAALSSRSDRISLIESSPKVGGTGNSRPGMPSQAGTEGARGDQGPGRQDSLPTTGDSQLSSISVARSRAALLSAQPNRRGALGLGALALLAGGLLAFAWLRDGEPPESAAAGDWPAAPVTAPTPAETVTASDDPTLVDTAPPPPSAPSAASTASATASASAEPTASTGQPKAPWPKTTPRPVAPKPPKTSCSPPYTVDADGIRHIKPECVK
ncbi:MAG: serine/threonine protein kinase [Deltaproteobacteria bacterium]|nr:serine/threonine protein kinase [Deltaproteobacteria bacterium]